MLQPLSAMNTRSDAQAARLLPSGRGWFLASQAMSTATWLTKSGYSSRPEKPAIGACSAESARARSAAPTMVATCWPVTSTAIAR